MGKIEFQADDFGYSDKSDTIIKRLFKDGRIVSFSLLSNFVLDKKEKSKVQPWLKNLKRKKGVAVHINLVEGRSILGKRKCYSLVDKKGFFYSLPIFLIRLFFGFLSISELKKEIEAQIKTLTFWQIKLDELNSHQHIHALSPIAEIFIELAKKYRIKTVRSYRDVYALTTAARLKYLILKFFAFLSHISTQRKLGLPITWHLKADKKICFMSWESGDLRLDRLFKSGEQLRVVVHPGLPFDKNNKKLFNY